MKSLTSLCPHFGTCGGCDSQDKEYAEQLKIKETRLKELFSKTQVEHIAPIVPSPEIFYYRNKMEYAAGLWDGIKVIGLRQKNRFYRVVDLKECRIFTKHIPGIFDRLLKWMADNNIDPYHNLKRTAPSLKYLALRHSKYYDEIMATVVVSSSLVDTSSLLDEFCKMDAIKSVYLCINDRRSDVALSGEIRHLYGEPRIREKINDIDYFISPSAFFQTNSCCCNKLYGIIRDETALFGGNALDVCCGSGGITLQIAENFDEVTGIDICADSIEDAGKSAGINKIDNVRFLCEDAEKFLTASARLNKLREFSTIILDPPRAGLSKSARTVVLGSGVRNVVYVSCNPSNLAEDLKILGDSYSVKKLMPVDMFPHTPHAEVVAILKSNKV